MHVTRSCTCPDPKQTAAETRSLQTQALPVVLRMGTHTTLDHSQKAEQVFHWYRARTVREHGHAEASLCKHFLTNTKQELEFHAVH